MKSSHDTQTLPLWNFFQQWQRLDHASQHQSVDIGAYRTLIDALYKGIGVGSRAALFSLCRGLFLKPHHNQRTFETLFEEIWPHELLEEVEIDDMSSQSYNPEVAPYSTSTVPIDNPDSQEVFEPTGNGISGGSMDFAPGKETTTVAVRFEALAKADNSLNNIGNEPTWEEIALRQSFRLDGQYTPLDERTTQQHIRQLRRQTYQNAPLEVDIAATVERVTRQGIFDRLERRRNIRYEVPLVLLADRGGSMVAFHHFVDMVADAVQQQPGASVRYFQNGFERFLFRTPHLTESEAVENWKQSLPVNAMILIMSDAGAARGNYNTERIHQTSKMLQLLSPFQVVWLNPMPRRRWWGTSAMEVERHVPAYTFDEAEFSSTIKTLNGQLSFA